MENIIDITKAYFAEHLSMVQFDKNIKALEDSIDDDSILVNDNEYAEAVKSFGFPENFEAMLLTGMRPESAYDNLSQEEFDTLVTELGDALTKVEGLYNEHTYGRIERQARELAASRENCRKAKDAHWAKLSSAVNDLGLEEVLDQMIVVSVEATRLFKNEYKAYVNGSMAEWNNKD